MLPRDIKYREVSTSPRWTRVSPGGAWVVLNFKDNALFRVENEGPIKKDYMRFHRGGGEEDL